ncbi:MAG: mannonate dehydratase [Caldilineaceae bacterium]
MKLGLGLYRALLTPENLRFAKQAGCTHIIAHLPGHFTRGDKIITSDNANAGFGISEGDDSIWTYEGLRDLKAMVNAAGLELEALENFAPATGMTYCSTGPNGTPKWRTSRRSFATWGGWAFRPWATALRWPGYGGATKGRMRAATPNPVGFNNPAQEPIPGGMVWNMVYDVDRFNAADPSDVVAPVAAPAIWRRLEGFLAEMIPVAEEAGVNLAFHPDDPPLPTLRNTARLVYQGDHFQQVLDLQPSPVNKIEFCVGTISEMQNTDVYATVDRYSRARKLAYVHLRNVQGKAPHYHEMFVDDGDTDMIEVLRILHKNGFDGVLIPDHTPLLECAAAWHAGMAYTLGWMKAVLTIIEKEDNN